MTTTELTKALPEIITEQVPGPKSKALLDRRDGTYRFFCVYMDDYIGICGYLSI